MVPVGQIFGVPGEMRLNLSDALPHGLHALRAQFLILALGENETRLPMVGALEHDKNSPAANSAEQATGDLGFARKLW